ncbi:uncharacterized protein RSE6_07996 [Rhynchosporium secalis]|nr:uncharacterized protein RSE6_07996 [Rhynchosporium secalis]
MATSSEKRTSLVEAHGQPMSKKEVRKFVILIRVLLGSCNSTCNEN